MATLFNTKIKDTYQSLLKLEDNTILTTTTKNITDGLGNASPLYMSTTQVRIASTGGSFQVRSTSDSSSSITIGNDTVNSRLILWGGESSNGSIARIQGNGVVLNMRGSYLTIASSNLDPNNTPSLFGIRGVGSTSTTTSLLVQNSLATSTFSVNDAGDTTTLGNATFAGGFVQVQASGGSGIFASTYNSVVLRSAISWVLGNNTGAIGGSNGQIGYSSSNTPNVEQTYILKPVAYSHGVGEGRFIIQAANNAGGYNALGNMYIAGGRNLNGGAHGNVYLGVDNIGALGNVGIGTSSPAALLHVNGTSRFQGQASFGGALEFGYSGAFFQLLTTANNNYYFGSGTGVTSGGNVFARSIGTDNIISGTTGVAYAPLTITGGAYDTVATPSISFKTWDQGSQTTRFYINSRTMGGANGNIVANPDNGNFLIGTTTDSGFKLDVNGTARVNGVLTVGNSTITGNFGAMTLSNSGTAGVSLSFTNSRWGSDNPCNFGDQGINAHSSAQVEVRSSGRGFLPPRMTFTQRNAIATPATGLQVFDTNQNAICEYTGTAWRTISGGKQVNNATTGATTIDLSAGNVADVTLTLSTVITLTNPTVGTYVIKLIQDAIGGKVVSWPFNVLWSGGTPPTLTATANKTDVITLMYDGVNYYGTYALNF
jgi:hypothetical protein